MACMSNLVGIIVSGTYLAGTGEVKDEASCVLVTYAKLLGLHVHAVCWPCELYLECGAIFVQ